jgi:hypothetical protein
MDRSRGLVIARAALTALTLLTLAACNPFVRPYQRDPAVEMRRDGETMASQWNGTLAPTPGSGERALSGVVTVTPGLDGTSTYVSLTLASAPPGTVYPWQLREGPCGGTGGVVGTAAAYGALAVNDQGRAAASATVPLHLTPGARYHVRLGAASAPETAVACGELTPPTR